MGILSDAHTYKVVGNGDLEQRNSRPVNVAPLQSPSHQRASQNDLLSKDFSRMVFKREIYHEYCQKLQVLGLELSAEVDKLSTEAERLRAELAATSAPVNSTSSRRTTDDSDFCKKKAPFVSPGKVAVVYSSPNNDLKKLRGRDMPPESTYIEVALPPYHWGQDSLHMYFSIPRTRNDVASERPKIIVSSKKQQSTLDTELKFIRTINLGKLGFRVLVRRFFGQLKTIYVLAPETRAQHI